MTSQASNPSTGPASNPGAGQVLIYDRYPAPGYELVGGYLLWTTRVSCGLLLMTGPYPLFRMGD